jgi:hypothetical protein
MIPSVRNKVVLMNRLFFVLAVVLVSLGCSRKTPGDGATAQQTTTPGFNGTGVQVQNRTGDKGPTVFLFDKNGKYPDNTLADFMYFVPLVSPVPVSAVISPNNTQGGHILSYESGQQGNNFYVACEFRMEGKGFYLNEFDDDAMVEWNIKSAGNKKVLKNILDYIKFKGEGYGRIEARGTTSDSVMTVENVDVYFNARDAESPVTVGLYDVDITEKTNGHYKEYNNKVARITTLTFNRSEAVPRLELKISAVGKDEESLGTWEHVKGFVGNFFIEPIEIDKLGNNTMLEFGLTLYEKEAKFTFPKAKNLTETQEARQQKTDDG